jgi:hypothetical protein
MFKHKVSPCIKCKKFNSCTKMCERLEKALPKLVSSPREVIVDPARLEKFMDLSTSGSNSDSRTERWLKGDF